MKKLGCILLTVFAMACGDTTPSDPTSLEQRLTKGATTVGYECGTLEEGICTCSGDADCKAMEAVCATEIECPITLSVCWCIQARADDGDKPPYAPLPPEPTYPIKQ
jgi:hypothetical protein